MARGWESKSVEEQMETAESRRAERKSASTLTADQIRVARERESLEMDLVRVRREWTEAKHARHREQLEAAMEFLQRKLTELGAP